MSLSVTTGLVSLVLSTVAGTAAWLVSVAAGWLSDTVDGVAEVSAVDGLLGDSVSDSGETAPPALSIPGALAPPPLPPLAPPAALPATNRTGIGGDSTVSADGQNIASKRIISA
ncbi:MAG TPA: hypothetical protein VLX09_06900 [Stellaceae bacterium]|nr:hypothetical protein [Stellaceae bacterium]